MVRETLPERGTRVSAQDRALHRRLADGEAAALGECYDRFAPVVHGLARSVLADDRAADRVTCEVFARLWERPERYDRRVPLRSWLTGLARLLAVQHLRDARTGRTSGEASGEASREVYEQLERSVHEASVAARADQLVTSMPAELRSALELAYFRRRDCRQTAADLGITEADTRRRLRLGLHLLASAHTAAPCPAPGVPGIPGAGDHDRPRSPA